MKVLKKIILILVISLMIFIPRVLAVTNEATNEINENQTNYNIISEEGKTKFKSFVKVKKDYEKFCILEGILFFVAIVMVIKTKAIDKSTKKGLLIAVLVMLAYVLRFSVEGNIIYILDVTLQILGVILIVLAYYYIYKHQNLLIYVPICIFGIFYVTTNITIVKNNVLYQMFLMVSPFVLFVLGTIIEKVEEKELLKPVKEKHPKK